MAPGRRPADTKAALRDAQRAYIRRAVELDPKRRSLTEIAREGGLNHSTLTRFMNNAAHKGTLDTLTILRVAEVTGVQPDASVAGGAVVAFREDAEPYSSSAQDNLATAVKSLIRGRTTADAWVLRSRAVELAGYVPGDVVILDQAEQPQNGDLVCAQVYDRRGGAETIWRIYEAPYLTAASPDPALRKPILVDGHMVLIRGVVTESLRAARATNP